MLKRLQYTLIFSSVLFFISCDISANLLNDAGGFKPEGGRSFLEIVDDSLLNGPVCIFLI